MCGIDTSGKKPMKVRENAKQIGDIRARWAWVEPSVWTEHMLTALEKGVKGGVWFSLIDKVYAKRNLYAAFRRIWANRGSAGVDHVTVKRFLHCLENNMERVHKSLKEGTYCPQKVRRVYIPKVGSKEKRPLGIPTVRDRIVQASLRHVIEPIFEREFTENNYGFRPGRSCKDALRKVDSLLESGYEYVADVDFKRYFDSIPHDKLMSEIRRRIADGRVLQLIEAFLKQGIMEGLREWSPVEGTPQGGVISPVLANIYLLPLDCLMEGNGYSMVRYADDLVVMCRSEVEARNAMELIRKWTQTAGLELHSGKSQVVDTTQLKAGFDFLGYHFERTCTGKRMNRWPRKKSLSKFKDTIRARTKRCSGRSLGQAIILVNSSSKGWFEYFKHSHKSTFKQLDGWIRMRLRSMLRKRSGRRGRGRGYDNNRWTNAYFAARELFSMVMAHEAACQSARR